MLVILTGCFVSFLANTPSTKELEAFLSTPFLESLNSEQQIIVARAVKNERNAFVMTRQQHVLTGEKIKIFKELLLNDDHYIFDMTKKCLFIPEAIFQFEEGSIMINLFCNQVKFVLGDKTLLLDYDPMADEFNGFCREILEYLDKHKM